jgi:hypothetical protein
MSQSAFLIENWNSIELLLLQKITASFAIYEVGP